MNVASRELCEKLYKVSGWTQLGEKRWVKTPVRLRIDESDYRNWQLVSSVYRGESYTVFYPAYNLGYLLEKLPSSIWSDQYNRSASLWMRKDLDGYKAWYWANDPQDAGTASEFGVIANTPDDAICKLAIQLFEQGILKRESPS